jgi:parallel beta-helix repeat protein
MNRKLAAALTIVLVGMMGLSCRVQTVEASGTIYIRADGSIDPPTAPISTSDNVTYTLTGNITVDNFPGALLVGRDNIVVDGDGYAVTGGGIVGSRGIALGSMSNVTVRNMTVNNFYYGISLYFSSGNTLSGNKIANNNHGIWLDSSSGSSLSGNNIANNVYRGIDLVNSSSNTLSGNNVTANGGYGIGLYLSSSNIISGNTFANNGLSVYLSYQNSVENNTVNGRPLVYLEGVSNFTVKDAGQVILVRCDNIRVEGLDLSRTDDGVILLETNNSIISGNNITANSEYGINLEYSNSSSIYGNNITNNWGAIELLSSSNNSIYHNSAGSCVGFFWASVNIWDDGYPSGGNYWSNYNGTDGNGDGVGDTPYIIHDNNIDNYPLMGMFSEFDWISIVAPEQRIKTICNSTISNLIYNGTAISFDVTGDNGTSGFCRIQIPKVLMNSTFAVIVNGTEIAYTLLPFSNENYTYLYFNYTHSTEQVIIIPEFPVFFILPLFMMATLLAVIVYRRKHAQRE